MKDSGDFGLSLSGVLMVECSLARLLSGFRQRREVSGSEKAPELNPQDNCSVDVDGGAMAASDMHGHQTTHWSISGKMQRHAGSLNDVVHSTVTSPC